MSDRYFRPHSPDNLRTPVQNRRRKLMIGTLITATSVVGVAKAADLHTSAGEKRQKSEAKLLEKMRGNEIETKVDTSVFILHAGVKYRKTPDMANPDPAAGHEGNISGTVKSGQVLIVERPLRYENKDGSWLGFKLSIKENGAQQTADVLAKQMQWVNISTLSDQRDRNNLPLYEEFQAPSSAKDTLNAHIDANGNIEVTEGDVAAQAQSVDADQAAFILEALGVRDTA